MPPTTTITLPPDQQAALLQIVLPFPYHSTTRPQRTHRQTLISPTRLNLRFAADCMAAKSGILLGQKLLFGWFEGRVRPRVVLVSYLLHGYRKYRKDSMKVIGKTYRDQLSQKFGDDVATSDKVAPFPLTHGWGLSLFLTSVAESWWRVRKERIRS